MGGDFEWLDYGLLRHHGDEFKKRSHAWFLPVLILTSWYILAFLGIFGILVFPAFVVSISIHARSMSQLDIEMLKSQEGKVLSKKI
jgi:hypothetical protein